jgi:dihydrofolate reductase
MTTDTFKLTIHLVCSLDGYVAKKDNSTSWFETTCNYEKGLSISDRESADFLATIDCYLMGSKTYEMALELSKEHSWPYGDTPTIVLTTRTLHKEIANIEFHSGDLTELIKHHLKPRYKNVWMVGGPTLARNLICQNLADEIRMSILPIILGDGTPFFNQLEREQLLHLKDVKAYNTGMVELVYGMKK